MYKLSKEEIEKIDHSIDVEKNNQFYRLELVSVQVRDDENMIEIYQAKNFFGYAVTFGVLTEIHNIEVDNTVTISLLTKAAVCSEEDTFSPELGITIVTGRLMRDSEEVNSLLTCESLEESSKLSKVSIKSRAEKLADYLLKKSENEAFLRMQDSMIKSTLKRDFEDFK